MSSEKPVLFITTSNNMRLDGTTTQKKKNTFVNNEKSLQLCTKSELHTTKEMRWRKQKNLIDFFLSQTKTNKPINEWWGYSNKYNIMRIDFKWYNEVHHKAELRTRRGLEGEERRGEDGTSG